MNSKVIVPDYRLPGKPETSIGVRIIRITMVLLFLLFILGWLAIPPYSESPKRIKGSATKATISNVKAALEQFKMKFSRYPTSAEGLESLVEAPASLAGWDHPFMERMPTDGWGQGFVYRSPGVDDPAGYDLYSIGGDGQDGTADDISKNDI